MCGIFAYIGTQNNAAEIVLQGLKVLEYRGYDSWGIAVKSGDSIAIEKHVGKIGDAVVTLPESSIGIGHTRWATHGGVTVTNAHPHKDCTGKIALLHNGIIENFQELKNELIEKGHTFVSETDTEVASHMIEEYGKTMTFVDAVRSTFNRLQGLNAIVAMHTTSDEVIAAKNGSPLVVGIGDNELFLASDVTGILPHTRNVFFLKDNEMVVLGNEVTLFSLPDGQRLEPTIEKIDWKIEATDKGSFEHFMLKEIYEQPNIIRNIAEEYGDQIEALAEVIKKAKGTFFIGAGTAYYATIAGVYLFSKIAKMHVNTAPASEFNYLEDFLNDESLVIALSQSGETIDIVEPLTRAKEKHSQIVGIVNTLGSTIYRMSDYKMLLGAGPEKAVASTKAYTAKIAILIMLVYAIKGELEKAKEILLSTTSEIDRLLEDQQAEQIKQLAQKLVETKNMYTIGRSISYATALEAALKTKEVSYIHTEGLAGGELKHGPIALIEEGTPCIVFAPSDETYDAIISNATEIKARGGYIIGVSAKQAEVFDEWIEVKDTGVGSAITSVIPMQLFAYYLALYKHLDPDKPRNLAKSVTVK